MVFKTLQNLFWSCERRVHSSTRYLARFGFSPTSSVIKELGKLLYPLENSSYPIGQIFIHRLFAYRGVVVLSSKCKVEEKGSKSSEMNGKVVVERPFYQALIHRGDWEYMGFPVNLTTYLGEGGARQEKILTVIHGMDCVAHEDLLPISAHEQRPIDHDLFDRIFTKIPKDDDSNEYKFAMHPELEKHSLTRQQNKWLSPYHVYREITSHIEVTVTTFYLGTTVTGGQSKHLWRYIIRIHNLEPSKRVILRERNIKVFSLNNMHQMSGIGVVGTQPELSITQPAFQFSSTVEFPHPKGGHLWGKFKMERVEDRSLFDVAIPSIVLESDDG